MLFHQLLCFHMCGQCLISGLVKEGESILESGEEGLSDLRIISWFISENEAKWVLLGG